MTCYHPIEAWRHESGAVFFGAEKKNHRPLQLPCGRCIGCRIARQKTWAIRCMHEASLHQVNAFITLTYDEDHYTPTLDYTHYQAFMHRLRKELGPTRFFVAGEYGSKTQRPHWHALLFGQTFNDLKPVGENLSTSRILEKLWGHGYASVGRVTYESAAYVAKYTCKRINGPLADSHYLRVDLRTGEYVRVSPEMAHMSLNPGIGAAWIDKNWREVYGPRDAIVTAGGRKQKPPRYYDKRLEKINQDLRDAKDADRYREAKIYLEETTPERLRDREICAIARQNSKSEKL